MARREKSASDMVDRMKIALAFGLALVGCGGSEATPINTDAAIDVLLDTATVDVAMDDAATVDASDARSAVPPPVRYGHAAAYLGANMIVFGGSDNANVFDDTWSWDGNAWSHLFLSPPPQRYYHAVATDSAKGELVMFGGHSSVKSAGAGQPTTTAMADTWVFNGSNWAQRLTVSAPSPRLGHRMAYDAKRARVVLFGGNGNDGKPLADTWTWDGNTWTPAMPVKSPPARSHHAMVYDSVHEVVVLTGGYGGGGPLVFDDTWSWDGTNWTPVTPMTIPPKRTSAAIGFDGARAMTFGGWGGPPVAYLADAWLFDGTNWAAGPMTQPTTRILESMAYDPARKVTTLFGGWDEPGNKLFNETWEWSGSAWTQR